MLVPNSSHTRFGGKKLVLVGNDLVLVKRAGQGIDNTVQRRAVELDMSIPGDGVQT